MKRSGKIQDEVVKLYERHPFPSVSDPFRKVAEEMDLRLKLLGLQAVDYKNKIVLDAGCGTGEYTCWHAVRNKSVTGVDLSKPSLNRAREYAASYNIANIDFKEMSVLDLQFPDNSFDLSYSMGVLHHTPDPYKGFCELVRVTRPGGIVIASVYNKFGRLRHNLKQKWVNALAGENPVKRVETAKKWFPKTCRQLKKRMRSESETILYDAFGIPHESQHSIGEILKWFSKKDLKYLGAFGPVTLRDTLYALRQPEYSKFEESLEAFPLALAVGRKLRTLAEKFEKTSLDELRKFETPSWISRTLVQCGWFILGFRFSIFSMAGRKL
jgi:ubiquinone/menaquinone biosynthesis C-methylase UbiE